MLGEALTEFAKTYAVGHSTISRLEMSQTVFPAFLLCFCACVMLGMMLASPDRWDEALDHARGAGVLNPAEVPLDYKNARKLLRTGNLRVELPTTDHVARELQTLDRVNSHLARRHWALLKARNNYPFITCDHAYCLQWIDPAHRKMAPPGLALPSTEILFPVSSELALRGTLEREGGHRDLSDTEIASFNGVMVSNAERQVYARDQDFNYMLVPDTRPKAGSSLVADRRFVRIEKPKPYSNRARVRIERRRRRRMLNPKPPRGQRGALQAG